MKSSNVKTNTVHTKALYINNISFQESVGFIYINNYSLPLDINSYLFTDFNLLITNNKKVFITLKANYNIKIYDINNLLLFAVQNTTTKTMFMIDINYNSAYYRIDINLKNN